MRSTKNLTIKERFARAYKVMPNGCWLWTMASTGRYGQITINRKPTLGHRLSYELHKGPIPKGLYVCHTCDNGHCVNPGHLFLGTPADNSRDFIEKGGKPGAYGSSHYRTKLTESDVQEIRSLYKNSRLTLKQIGKQFGLNAVTIHNIVHRKTWTHVP